MKYAVIKTGGKQYKVAEGDLIEVERLAQENGNYTFDEVLLYVADGVLKVGNPVVTGIKVEAVIEGPIRGEKIRVAKFKAKARHRRVMGHRQALSRVKIASISSGEKAAKSAKETPAVAAEQPVEKKVRKPRVKKA